MMLRTHSGYVNTDQCLFLRCRWNKQKPHESALVGEYVNGTSVNETIVYSEWQEFEMQVGYLAPVPSPPGYFLLRYWYDEDGEYETPVERTQVLAWVFDGDLGYHRVYTGWDTPGRYDDSNAILCPDGRVIDPGESTWESEEEWLKEKRRDREAKKARSEEAAK